MQPEQWTVRCSDAAQKCLLDEAACPPGRCPAFQPCHLLTPAAVLVGLFCFGGSSREGWMDAPCLGSPGRALALCCPAPCLDTAHMVVDSSALQGCFGPASICLLLKSKAIFKTIPFSPVLFSFRLKGTPLQIRRRKKGGMGCCGCSLLLVLWVWVTPQGSECCLPAPPAFPA